MTFISNSDELNKSEKRLQIIEMIEAGLKAVSPETLLFNSVKYNDDFNSVIVHNDSFDVLSGRIFVIGAGKASAKMAQALEKIIGPEKITAGFVNSTAKSPEIDKIIINQAGHPLPDKDGLAGTEKMLALKEEFGITKKDLVINLVSGGASSMLVAPRDGISLADKQRTTQALLECGATIQEINIVRKHISAVKGGQLAEHFMPARVLSLIISDVTENDLAAIGSGPTVSDPTGFKEALSVIEKYHIAKKIPPVVYEYLAGGSSGTHQDTPKKLSNAYNYIIGNSASALEAMAHQAKNLGLEPMIVSAKAKGDPVELALEIDDRILKGEFDGIDVVLFAGEVTPTLPDKYGQGGRNQHFAALNMIGLKDLKADWAMASVASDGRDYTEGVAGSIVDDESLAEAKRLHLDIEKLILSFDSFNLFKALPGSLIKMAPTGTNIGDLMIFVLENKQK